MTISRRDTIIIAVLINTGILAVLFMTAMHYDEDPLPNIQEISAVIAENQEPIPLVLESKPALQQVQVPSDQVDQALQRLSFGQAAPSVSNPPALPAEKNLDKATVPLAATDEMKYVEIVVKKGDFLEKIARANGTSVEEIKRANNLSSDNLVIGQVLRIAVPVKKETEKKKIAQTPLPAQPAPLRQEMKQAQGNEVYYVIKSGDNPWKIARQFQVKYEDILSLNKLNEDTARNLRPGDKIRIK